MILKLRDSHIASLVKHSNSSNLREMEGEESRGDNEATGHGSSVVSGWSVIGVLLGEHRSRA